MKKRFIWTALFAAFTVFIFCRSLKSADESTMESAGIVSFIVGWVERLFSSPPENLADFVTVIVRKLAHIAEFAVQSVLACKMFTVYGLNLKKCLSWILLIGLMTACVDEAIQLTSPGRAGLITDVFIDFAGTALGFMVCYIFNRKKA